MSASQTPPAFRLPAALLSQGYALRPETDRDIPFLMQLYASTREDELAPIPWTAEQKLVFLASQFQAQRHHYRTYFPTCAFDIVERHSSPVGRLYLDARDSWLHVIDIALLPDCRGQGVGTAILEALQAEALASGRGIDLFVEKTNPGALKLYRRLGFTDVSDHPMHLEIEWRPENVATPQLNVAQ